MLINFEDQLSSEYGEEFCLGDRLSIPLHLQGFRAESYVDSVKKLQSRLPLDVSDFLSRHRQEQTAEVASDSSYSMKVFLVAVAANRASSAEMVVNFVRDGDVDDDMLAKLQGAVVISKDRQIPVASGHLVKPSAVWVEVQERTALVFNNNRHARAAKFFGVRPFGSAVDENPTATVGKYCVYDNLMGGYGYTRAWIEKLVKEFESHDRYEEIVGMKAVSAVDAR